MRFLALSLSEGPTEVAHLFHGTLLSVLEGKRGHSGVINRVEMVCSKVTAFIVALVVVELMA